MLLSGRPVYDPNPLRPNPNPEKSVSGSCRVRGLGRTLTPLQFTNSNLLNLKLSPVRILFQATHQTKKEIHLGALTLQIAFQEKTVEGESLNLL